MDEALKALQELIDRHYVAGPQCHGLTTSELFAVVDEHAPGKFTASQLYDTLSDMKVATKLHGNEVRWLLHAR